MQSQTFQPIAGINKIASINNNYKNSEKTVIIFKPNNNNDATSIFSNSTDGNIQQMNFQNEINSQINTINNNMSNQNQIISQMQKQLN